MSMTKSKSDEVAVSNVPLLDLKAQYASLREEIQSAISEVCESQHFVMGPKVIELEEAIAAYSGARHGIGVSSGTDALLVALMALDIGPGDEVITSPFSFFATAGVIARLGARPVFCDIESDSYNLDAGSVRHFIESSCTMKNGALVNNNTGGTVRVLMPVHLFGQVADMQKMLEISREFNLRIVEDAAQAIGAKDADGQSAGSIGDIGCFSFFPSKNLGAFGDGGMCVTNDDDLADRLRILRLHGGKPKYYHAIVGGNFRLDAIQAAILLVKLKYLDGWSGDRQKNARRYNELLESVAGEVTRPYVRDDVRHIYNQYTIAVDDRDGLREFLQSKNIGSEVYYPIPLHLQKCFEYLDYKQGDCPKAESAAARVLSVPIYPELSRAQQEYVAAAVDEFVCESAA